MKLISWNVNGLRAAQKKGFDEYLAQSGSDIFCIQETKLQQNQLELLNAEYETYFSFAQKKGYAGTAIFTKKKPIGITKGIGNPLDAEGRTVCAEYEEFYLVCCYTPNSQRDLKRLELRLQWDKTFQDYVCALDRKKPVLICGDLNVAHQSIDLKNPKTNEMNAGYSIQERESFSHLLDRGFIDTFRYLHPTTEGAYSWWSFRPHVREHNIGWRIDYWLASERLKDSIIDSSIDSGVMGSDHAPVILRIK
ncbi:MAG: exodeoxyribonuclease III [Sphaerochaetaceae bacterium]